MDDLDFKPVYYTLSGHDIVRTYDVSEWAKSFEGDRHVANTYIPGALISTVFLGLDHNFSHEGPPLVFETMVFPSYSFMDAYCERCSTWQEAEEQHKIAVKWARGQWLWRIKNIGLNGLRWMELLLRALRKQDDTQN